MASSRLEKIGTIWTRVEGLMKAGAMKHVDRPLWFDVYAAFPPKYEPVYGRIPHKTEYRQLLYKEDIIRAKFYRTFGSPGTINMSDPKPTVSQMFIEKYFENERLSPKDTPDQIFESTKLDLEKQGVLASKSPPKQEEVVEKVEEKSSSDTPSEGPEPSLADMFKNAMDSR